MSAPDEPTSPAAAGDDAAARRAARKARILGAGGDRLARITKTGRGEEANTLYAAEEKAAAAKAAAPASSAQKSSTPVASALAAASFDDDPDDVDISTLRAPQQGGMQQQQAQLPNIPGLDQLPPGMQDMFAQLQAAMGGAGGAEGGSPFGGAEGMAAGFAPPPPQPASRLDAIFEVARVVICAAFGLFLVAPLFKAHRAASISEQAPHLVHGGALLHWARLGYERPNPWDAGAFGLESLGFGGVPPFYLFLTLEIALQSTRIMLMRSRPPPPSILQKVLPFLPSPLLRTLILTASRYLSLLNAFVNDVAVVVFVLGVSILLAGWRVGYDPLGAAGDAAAAGLGLSSGGIEGIAAAIAGGSDEASKLGIFDAPLAGVM